MSTRSPTGPLGLGARLLLALVVLNAVVVVLGTLALRDARPLYEQKVATTTQNLAQLLDQSIASAIEKIDLAVQNVVDELEGGLAQGRGLDPQWGDAMLARHLQRLNGLSSLRVADARGDLVLGPGVDPAHPVSWADRSFFAVHRELPDAGLIVTNPIVGRISNTWVVAFVRRFNAPDGSFAGVVSAAMPIEHFQQLLATLDLGPHGIALLRDADRGLIARHPPLAAAPGRVGAKGFSAELAQAIDSGRTRVTFHAQRTADGVERTSSYRKLTAAPFHLVVGMGSEDYLAGWYADVRRTIALGVLFLLLSSAGGWLLWRSMVRQSQAAGQIRQLNADLEQRVRQRTTELEEANARLVYARDAAEAANRAKTAFLANMSHEIRTPMNAILGMASLLRIDGVTPEQAKRLDRIDSAGAHLMQILGDVLDIAKIEADKLVLESAPVDPLRLLERVQALVQQAAAAKGLALAIEGAPLPAGLLGDPTRLQQALLNYASNAVKFTERGAIVLRARLQSQDADGALLRFEVQDSGIGIAPEIQPRLFAAFEQADSSTTRRFGGTGLGLAITRRLAEAMGGSAGVDSVLGSGSRFWFTARLRKAAARDEAAGRGAAAVVAGAADVADAALERLRRDHAGRRILLVEDEPTNRELARCMLEQAGLSVLAVDDGLQAVAAVERETWDLVLMDMQMPGIDGLEATRRIRRLARGRQLPIAAMTANAYDEDRERCTEAGMDDFIAKPVQLPRLCAVVLKWLEAGARAAA
ncbi:MAG: response regulator [Burkholderiaceae bacterium]|nr:response regulator [Burkholderiaceae bacterium]